MRKCGDGVEGSVFFGVFVDMVKDGDGVEGSVFFGVFVGMVKDGDDVEGSVFFEVFSWVWCSDEEDLTWVVEDPSDIPCYVVDREEE